MARTTDSFRCLRKGFSTAIASGALSLFACMTPRQPQEHSEGSEAVWQMPRNGVAQSSSLNDSFSTARLPTPGRYVGALRLGEGKGKMAAQLDLILEETTPTESHYRGVLVVSLGGKTGHEYASAYFAKATYRRQGDGSPHGSFSFEKSSNGVALRAKVVGAKVIAGLVEVDLSRPTDVSNAWSQQHSALQQNSNAGSTFVGALSLHLKPGGTESNFLSLPGETNPSRAGNEVFAKERWRSTLAGQYAGECDGAPTKLHIESGKWRVEDESDRLHSPFAAHRISGRVSGVTDFCHAGGSCIRETYANGWFDPFQDLVRLERMRNDQMCDWGQGALVCGSCVYHKKRGDEVGTSREIRHKRRYHLEAVDAANDGEIPKAGVAAQIRGQFYGYLHHEATDHYQLMAFNVKTFESVAGSGANGETSMQVEGFSRENLPTSHASFKSVATLYFGEGDSDEFVAYEFSTQAFPGSARSFVLDGVGESFLHVTQWREKTIEAIWYSKTRGRIGTVQVTRGLLPKREAPTPMLRSLSGRYQSDDWSFEMIASASLSEGESDFYPLQVYGWAKSRLEPGARRHMIEDGVYDFFLGRVAFLLDDGRFVQGQVTDKGMELYFPPRARFGNPTTNASYTAFVKVDPQRESHAKYMEIFDRSAGGSPSGL